MKAERIHSYGGPDVLKLEEVPRPEPGSNQLLARVHAAGVNPADWKFREGMLGRQPLPSAIGNDFSGVVEAVGPGAGRFRVGQQVFGSVADDSGSYAEYALASVSGVAEKPEGLDHIHAAALPVAGLTAWQALFDEAKIKPGQKVLIHAASGGVGSMAVQFAKWKGASCIGTASAERVAFVRNLGADQVIDYKKTKFEEVVRDVDMVLDTIGGETQERSWGVLKKGGILVSTVRTPSEVSAKSHEVRGLFMRCDLNRSDELAQIAKLVASGTVKVHVETVLPLADAARAQEISQRGHAHGKIVLKVA
jgi:NADPH:quinone reductase-like Zn-dependent oxidoreductase